MKFTVYHHIFFDNSYSVLFNEKIYTIISSFFRKQYVLLDTNVETAYSEMITKLRLIATLVDKTYKM